MKRLFTLVFLFLALFVNAQTADEIRGINGLVAWFSADSVHLTADNHVDTLYDKSGNGMHAIQNTIGKQPVWIDSDSSINHQTTLSFDGNDLLASISNNSFNQPNTFFIVWNTNSNKTCIAFTGQNSSSRNQLVATANDIYLYGGASLSSKSFYAPFSYAITKTTFNGNNSLICNNGRTLITGNAGIFSQKSIIVGADNGGGYGLTGNIAELIFINDTISPSDSATIIDYLRDKYAPNVSLHGLSQDYGFKPVFVDCRQYPSFSWSDGCADTVRAISISGFYKIDVTDHFGFHSSDSANISLVEPHSLPDTTICLGDTITWNPDLSGPYTYKWSDGSTGKEFTIATEGKYWVVITDTAGYEWHSDTIYVAVDSISTAQLFNDNLTVCSGENISCNYSDACEFLWSTGEAFDHIAITESEIYWLKITDSHGCNVTDTFSVNVNGIAPSVSFTCSPVEAGNPSVFINGSFSNDGSALQYLWDFGDGTSSADENPTHSYEHVGSYNVTLLSTTGPGCNNSFSATATVNINSSILVEPIFPLQAQHIFDKSVHFKWNSINGCRFYHILIDADSTFANPAFDIDIFSTDTTIVLGNGTYYWKIKSEVGSYGQTYSFSVNSLNTIHGLVAWFSADSVHLTADNHVDTLYDKSGNEMNAIQNTIGKQPIWIDSDSSINNQPILSFDGNDLLASISNDLFNQPNTFFIVWNTNSSKTGIAFTGQNSSSRNQLVATANDIYLYGGVSLSSKSFHAPFCYAVTETVFNGNNSLVFNNGQTLITGNAGTFSQKGLFIGAENGGGYGLTGNIAELIFINDTLSPSDSAIIIDYLRDKYAPNVSLHGLSQDYGFKPVVVDCGQYPSFSWSDDFADTVRVFTHSGFYKVTATDIFGFTSSDSAYISLVEPHFLPDTTICLGDTITWNPDLSGPYSYKWSDGSTGKELRIATEGIYWVVITDTAGYEWNSDTISVIVDTYVNRVSLGNDTISTCAGNNIYLQTGYEETASYLWSDGTTADHIAINESGLYSVTATDSIGCKVSKSAYFNVVGIAPTPDFTFSAPCATRSIAFTDKSHSNDNSTISSYKWTFGDGTASETVSPAHTYKYSGNYNIQLAITSSKGCENVLKHTIHIDSLPNAGFAPTQCCSYAVTQFTDRSTTTDSYINSWQWMMNDTTYTERNPQTTYNTFGEQMVSLIVVTAHGCSDTLTRTINVKQGPNVDFTYSPACINTPVYFTNNTNVAFGLATNYTWRNDTTKFSSQKSPTYTFRDTGTYHITLTASQVANNCASSVSKDISIRPNPLPAIIANDFCSGQPSTLTGINNEPKSKTSAWVWNMDTLPAINGQQIRHSFATEGRHKTVLTVTDSTGCTESFDTTIYVNITPVAAFRPLSVRGPIPFDAEFINNSDKASNYIWHFGDGQQSTETDVCHTYNYEDAYTVQLIALNGECADTAARTITAINPHSNLTLLSATAETGNGFISVKATIANQSNFDIAGIDIEWHDNLGHQIRESISDTIKENKILQYQFGANIGDAKPSRLEYICVTAQPSGRFIDEDTTDNEYCIILNGNKFTTFAPKPNPADSKLEIGFIVPDNKDVKIELLDARGKLAGTLYEGPATIGFNSFITDISRYSSGVYFYRISHDGQSKTHKIIISHE